MMQARHFRSSHLAISPEQSARSKGVAPGGGVLLLASMLTVLAVMVVMATSALAQTPFYHGKTVKIVVAGTSGGTADFRVRELVPFLRKPNNEVER